MAQSLHKRKYRKIWTCFTSIIFALFGLMICSFILFYSLPKSEKVEVGALTQFPVSNEPYRIETPELLYLVHTSDQLFVFKPQTPHYTNYRYVWFEIRHYFADPLTASRFGIDGTYLCGPADRGLDQFAYEIKEGKVWVILSHVIKGEAVQRKTYTCPTIQS